MSIITVNRFLRTNSHFLLMNLWRCQLVSGMCVLGWLSLLTQTCECQLLQIHHTRLCGLTASRYEPARHLWQTKVIIFNTWFLAYLDQKPEWTVVLHILSIHYPLMSIIHLSINYFSWLCNNYSKYHWISACFCLRYFFHRISDEFECRLIFSKCNILLFSSYKIFMFVQFHL